MVLSDLFDVIGGGTPKTTEDSYWNGTIPWLSVKDFGGGKKYVYSTEKTITEKGLENSSTKLLYKDDTIISARGTVGEVAMIPFPMAFNQSCFGLRSREGNNPHFIFYLVKHKVNELKSQTQGSVFDTITKATFDRIECEEYPIEKQNRIANILSSLDRKIELNNKINAQLEEMAQAIFKSWFVDFEPFKDGKFVESELGMIPEGWRVGTLGDVADINPKRPLKKGEEATYLDMKNMPTSGSFPNQWEKKIMNGGMKFQNGDTLMARITPCLENGKVAYVNFLDNDEVGFGSTEYIVMTSKNGVFPEIFYTLCRYPDFVAYATRNMNGSSGRQRVSGEVIGNYKLVIPPTSVIEKLQPLYASIMEQIKEHGFENLHLSHLRDTLLPKLMSGEINI